MPAMPAPVVSAVMPTAPIQEEMVELEIPFIAIDGSPASVTLHSDSMDEARKTVLLTSCCPCCVGGIRSPERVAEMKNLLKRVTFWIVVAQLIMFIVSLGCSGGFASLSDNPLIGPSVEGLVNSGAKYTYAIIHGGIHRLLVPLLLHANIFHLALNIWAELVVCMYAEHTLQAVRLGLIFLGSGLGATILSAIISPDVISVGASGAVMGVMSVLLVNAIFVCSHQHSLFSLLSITFVFVYFSVESKTGERNHRSFEVEHDSQFDSLHGCYVAAGLCSLR